MLKKNDLVYICSPLCGKTQEETYENMEKARTYMSILCDDFGYRGVAPHAYFPLIIDDNISEERELALDFGLGLLALSKGVVLFGNKISIGMAGEIVFANYSKIPIYQYNEKTLSIEKSIHSKA